MHAKLKTLLAEFDSLPHRYPVEDTPDIIKKSEAIHAWCKKHNEHPPERPLDAVSKGIKAAMNALDQDVYEKPGDDDALKTARAYGLRHFVASKHRVKVDVDMGEGFAPNAGGSGSDTESDTDTESEVETEVETDTEKDADVIGSMTPEQRKDRKRKQFITRTKRAMKEILSERDDSAKLCHENWDNIPAMKRHSKKAHELHRDYLRLAYSIKEKPLPIPRQIIEAKHTKLLHLVYEINSIMARLHAIMEKKKDISGEEIDGMDETLKEQLEELAEKDGKFRKQLQVEIKKFHTKSHPYLASLDDCIYQPDPENYYFYDDGKGKPSPLEGDDDIDPNNIPHTENQRRRFKRRKEIPNVVAYRGNLVAIELDFGDYLLESLSDQFLLSLRDLQRSEAYDAGDYSLRKLDKCKLKSPKEKAKLVKSFRKISGIAHRGVDTLNMLLVEREKENGKRVRVGDCMIKLHWSHGNDTWEIRSDYRQFRGQKVADWEIYDFARKARAQYKKANPHWVDPSGAATGNVGDYLVYEDTKAGAKVEEESEDESDDDEDEDVTMET